MARENDHYVQMAEYQVLKLLILYPNLDLGEVDHETFPHLKARVFYKAITKLRVNEEDINEGSLLRVGNELNSGLQLSEIQRLLSHEVSLSSLPEAIKVLKEASVKYKIHKRLEKLIDKTNSPDKLSTEFLSSAVLEMQDLISSGGSSKIKSYTLEECFDDYAEELRLRKLGRHYPFNDWFLDSHLTKRASPGQIILIAGSTGSGKSTLALKLINGLINTSIPNMYFSLEMDKISTFDRVLALRTGIELKEWYKSGDSIDPLIKRVMEEKESLKGLPFRFIDHPNVSLERVEFLIRQFMTTYKVDYACIFIDLITMIKDFISSGSGFKSNLATIMEIAVNNLNSLAKRLNVCIVAVAQMNREADSLRINDIEDIHKLRPTINHVKNSHALGERSRTVLTTFRPKYYADRLFPEDDKLEFIQDEMEVQIVKQSMGAVGMVGKYIFNGPTFSLETIKNEEQNEGVDQ